MKYKDREAINLDSITERPQAGQKIPKKEFLKLFIVTEIK